MKLKLWELVIVFNSLTITDLFLRRSIAVNAASTRSLASDLTLNKAPPSMVPLVRFEQDYRT